MNESQARTLEQVRQVLEGTQSLEFRRTEDGQGRYAWIECVLRHKRPGSALVLQYPARAGVPTWHRQPLQRYIFNSCSRPYLFGWRSI